MILDSVTGHIVVRIDSFKFTAIALYDSKNDQFLLDLYGQEKVLRMKEVSEGDRERRAKFIESLSEYVRNEIGV